MGIFSGKSARKLTIKSKQARQPLLPSSMQSFIARRLTDLGGGVFLLSGTALFLCLATYDAKDPSLNTAVAEGAAIANWLGVPGAYTADILMQTLGYASFVFAFGFGVWGYRIFKRLPLENLGGKVPLLVLSVLAASVSFARIPAPEALGIGSYMGGSAGGLLFNALGNHLQGWVGTTAFLFLAISAGAVFVTTFALSLGLSLREWIDGTKTTMQGMATARHHAVTALEKFSAWHARYAANDRGNDGDASIRRPRRIRLSEDSAPEPETAENDSDDDILPTLAAPKRKPIVAPRAEKAKPATREEKQQKLNLRGDDEWQLPQLEFLGDVPASAAVRLDEAALQKNAELLQSTLADFGVQGDITKVSPGPIVTLYEMEPAPGTKTSRVIGLADDIARSMSALSVRVAVVPGKNAIGMELPNAKREMVFLKELLSTKEYDKNASKLPLVLGKNIAGDPMIADLARMPHLLVAGTTGSGKSVAVNTMILSLLYRLSPEQCRFIMIDPKMLELSVYDDIPHLLTPVVTEAHRAVVALKWAVGEMEDRYRAMSKLGVRNIDGFNERIREARKNGEVLMHKVQTGFDPDTGKPVFEEQPIPLAELPFIVIIVDEFADLMLVAGKEVENAIQRLAQMARAAGIHLIMATQRPSVDVITGVIKANFPTRISFQVTSKIDSRTILGEGGAEQLLGQGDMLYMAAGGRITRVHGPFVSDDEVEKVVKFLKSQGQPNYIDGVTESDEEGDLFGGETSGGGEADALYDQAVAIVMRERKASTSFIQRHLQIGYNRAARIIERMEKEGIISQANHVGKREVLLDNYGT